MKQLTALAALLCLGLPAASQAAEPPAAQSSNQASKPAGDKTTAPAAAAPSAAKPLSATAAAAEPRASTSSSGKPAAGARKTNDRLSLDTTVVTGNRELPKVLYIVPWKKADIGDLPAKPFNTLLDEVLTPVDRDVFRREVTYYGAIAAGTEASAGGAAPPVSSSHGSEK